MTMKPVAVKDTAQSGKKQKKLIFMIIGGVILAIIIIVVIVLVIMHNLPGPEVVTVDSITPSFDISINSTIPTMNNIGYLLKGYNIFYGNPLPTGETLEDPGYRQMIFDAKYSGRTTSDGRYLVPDGVDLERADSCSYTFGSSFITGQRSYSESLGVKASVEGSFITGSFAASADYHHVEQSTKEGSSLFTHAEASCLVYSGNVKKYDHPPFSKNWQEGVKSLPKTYNSSKYSDFLETFGTHYIKSVSMGALFGQQSRLTTESYSRLVETRVDVSASAKYSAIEASVDANYDKKAAEEFKKATDEQSIYSRGSRPPKQGEIEEWLHQTFREPFPISIKLAPIYEIMDADQVIKSNLKNALDTYCLRLKAIGALDNCDQLKPDPPLPRPRQWTKWSHDRLNENEQELPVQECPEGQFITSIQFDTKANSKLITCSGTMNYYNELDCGSKGFRKITGRFERDDDQFYLTNVQAFCTDSYVEITLNDIMRGKYDNPMECFQEQKVVGIQAITSIDSNGFTGFSNLKIECA